MNIAVSSCRGQMSRFVIDAVLRNPELSLARVFARDDSPSMGEPVSLYVDCRLPLKVTPVSVQALSNVDVLIDFSQVSWTNYLLNFCQASNTKIIIGTTGITGEALVNISNFSRKVSCVFSPNMSVGMNIVYRILRQTLNVIGTEFALGLADSHHKHKKDSPSGTMKKILSIIEDVEKMRSICFEKDLTIMRLGELVGEHKVLLAGLDESIEIRHTAYSRRVFADGAIRAAKFLKNHATGLFDMDDVLSASLIEN